MHPYVLIPLISAVASAALASAVAARSLSPVNRNARANRLVSILLLSAAYWSLTEALWNLADDPAVALTIARWSALGSLTLGPICLHLFLVSKPEANARHGWLLPFSYASVLAFLLVSVSTDLFIETVVARPWGFAPVFGPAVPVAYAVITGIPVYVGFSWLRSRRPDEPISSSKSSIDSPWFELGASLPLVVASITDFVLPLFNIHVPRLGSASVALWGGIIWWSVYRFRDPILTPGAFAREIIDALPEAIALLRRDGTIRTINECFAALVGCDPQDLLGRGIREILVERSTTPTRVSEEHECDLVCETGVRIPVSVAASALYDRDGDEVGRLIVLRDLGDLVSLRSRIITSGRMAAVGELASGIAHEINNPTAYIRSNLKLLERHWNSVRAEIEKSGAAPAEDSVLDIGNRTISRAIEDADRVADIVRDVGGSAKGFETEIVDVNALLDTALRIAAPRLREIEVGTRFGAIPSIPCIPQEILQVFLNVISNAIESQEGRGSLRISTAPDGDAIVVRIEDDGCGISPETMERIFDPFFTTRPDVRGSGLGLPISRQIVVSHGGEIDVESEGHGGTQVRIRLPGVGPGAPDVQIDEGAI